MNDKNQNQDLGFFGELSQLLAQHQVNTAILSPGSRVAPITLALVRNPNIHTYIQIDERSAGYVALGMATHFLAEKENKQFVTIACTSGTAVLNYAPAIAEAFYQNIPLLVLTADRPPEWIDQQDGQAIKQNNVFENFVKKSYTLPTDTTHPDTYWHANRIINEAILALKTPPFQPIHINIPIREPFYPKADAKIDFSKKIRVMSDFSTEKAVKKEDWIAFREIWDNADHKIMLVGQGFWDRETQKHITEIAEETNTPIITEILSNLPQKNHFFIKNFDVFGGKLDQNQQKELKPDLLISWGGNILSKGLKQFFKKNKPQHHIHIQESGEVADTFQSITHILRINPCDFFKKLAEEIDYDAFLHKDLPDNNDFSEEFAQKWKDLDKNAQKYLYNFINNSENKLKFYELNILEQILSKIPKNTNVHLANSMSVRYANYWANHPNIQNNLKIYSNRGTSGIDGCTSTALGFALADENMLNVLVTGDLAFFYDRNAFFRKEIPKNLCVIVLNNKGGNIFRFVEGANQQPELEEFFETPHHFTAENTAKDANLDYFCAKNNTELEKSLTQVFLENAKNGLKNACILEIFTNKKENTDIFLAMKNGFS